MIQEEYRKINREDRGVKQAGFLVLWKTAMPSVLTEVGFISNPEDAKYLAKEKNHWLIAKSLFNSFSKYKGQLEGKKYNLLSSNDLPKVVENEDTTKEVHKNIPKDTIDKSINTIAINKPKQEQEQKQKDTTVINDAANDFQKIAEKLVNKAVQDTILFWVQIASSDKKIAIQKFTVKPVAEMKWDNLFKYLYGPLTTYAEIIEKQKDVKKQYPDAVIVATKNGKKIPLSDAIKQTKN